MPVKRRKPRPELKVAAAACKFDALSRNSSKSNQGHVSLWSMALNFLYDEILKKQWLTP